MFDALAGRIKTGAMKKKTLEKTELEKRLAAEIAEKMAATNAAESEGDAEEEEGEDLPNLEVLPEVDVEALTAERDSLKDQLLRARADFDNYRKRVARDDARLRKTAAEGIVRDLLPVLDNLERALAHADDESGGLAQGVDMVRNQFVDALARHGLDTIPAAGRPFDPNVHEAIACVPSEEVSPNHVVQEFQKGYRLGEHVLRPAKVVVSVAPAEIDSGEPANASNEEESRQPGGIQP